MEILTALENKNKRLIKEVRDIRDFYELENDPEIHVLQEMYENDIHLFFRDAWHALGSEDEFIPGRVSHCVSEHLKYFFNGDIKTLICVVPPRNAKSSLISVLSAVYAWIKDASRKILNCSYALELAVRDNVLMQKVIRSPWFQRIWGRKFHLTRESQMRTENSMGGERIVTHAMGKITGFGASLIMLDDMNNAATVQYRKQREKTNRSLDYLFTTRRNNLDTQILYVQQRLHMEDGVGHVISKEDPNVVYVNLQMEYMSKYHQISYLPHSDRIIWEDDRRVEGELLCNKRFSKELLAGYRLVLGSVEYNSNYQGLPVPDEGIVFNRDQIRIWREPVAPKYLYIITSWDTAVSTNDKSCYSAASTFGLFHDEFGQPNLMLLSIFSKKMEFPELLDMTFRLSNNYYDTIYDEPLRYKLPPDRILIESKSSGAQVGQILRRNHLPVRDYNPPQHKGASTYGNGSESKVVRARSHTPIVEAGRIWVMGDPNSKQPNTYGRQFIDALSSFPNSVEASTDIVDTFTMTLDFMKKEKMLYLPNPYTAKNVVEIYKKYGGNIPRHLEHLFLNTVQ